MHTVTMSATPIPRSLSDVYLLSTTEVFNIQNMPNGQTDTNSDMCLSRYLNLLRKRLKKDIKHIQPLIEDKQGVMEGILSVEQTYGIY